MPLSKINAESLLPLTKIPEGTNISTSAIGGNVNIDVSNSTVYFFNANTTANLTFNVRGTAQQTFDSVTAIGETTSLAIAVKQGTYRYPANLSIDGVVQTMYYSGNTKPTGISLSNAEINLFSYSIFKTSANAYTVITSSTSFGLG
jgi:hypothetical protein